MSADRTSARKQMLPKTPDISKWHWIPQTILIFSLAGGGGGLATQLFKSDTEQMLRLTETNNNLEKKIRDLEQRSHNVDVSIVVLNTSLASIKEIMIETKQEVRSLRNTLLRKAGDHEDRP